jgi:hypothetical protein
MVPAFENTRSEATAVEGIDRNDILQALTTADTIAFYYTTNEVNFRSAPAVIHGYRRRLHLRCSIHRVLHCNRIQIICRTLSAAS